MTYRPRRLRPHRSVTIVFGIRDEEEMAIATAAIRATKATGGPLFVPRDVQVTTVPGSARWYVGKTGTVDIMQWGVGRKTRPTDPEPEPERDPLIDLMSGGHTRACAEYWRDATIALKAGERWDHWPRPACKACGYPRRKADA